MGWVTGGGYGIDGGAYTPVWGWGAVAINRWCGGSVQVNGGIAWGVDYPTGSNVPSYSAMLRAVDRMHKDGTHHNIVYSYNPPQANQGANMIANGDLVNQGGSGIVTSASVQIAYIPAGVLNDGTYALDFYIDGVFRFNVGQSRVNLGSDQLRPGMTASFGFIPFASSLRVAMRQASGGATMHVDAGVQFVLGA